MVIGPDYLFIATPKTASRSMRSWLETRFGGRRPKAFWHHEIKIPPRPTVKIPTLKYIFTTRRHPIRRMISWWYFNTWHATRPSNRSLRQHIEWLLATSNKMPAHRSQIEFFQAVSVPPKFGKPSRHQFPMESMERDVLELLGRKQEDVCRLPKVTGRRQEGYKELKSHSLDLIEEVKDIFLQHSRPDFEAFGYPWDPEGYL